MKKEKKKNEGIFDGQWSNSFFFHYHLINCIWFYSALHIKYSNLVWLFLFHFVAIAILSLTCIQKFLIFGRRKCLEWYNLKVSCGFHPYYRFMLHRSQWTGCLFFCFFSFSLSSLRYVLSLTPRIQLKKYFFWIPKIKREQGGLRSMNKRRNLRESIIWNPEQ